MTETLCDSGHVKLCAGAKVSTALTGADYTTFINQAEGQIVADTGVNCIDIYSTMNADFRKILEQACAAWAGNKAIKYDVGVYTGGLQEATTMVNINLEEYDRAIAKLKDANVYEAFGGTKMTS